MPEQAGDADPPSPDPRDAGLRNGSELDGMEGRPPGDPEPTAFGSVISIGSHCLTSMQLKLTGLKLFSGPFDWIFSSLPMVSACVEDDFRTFLDQDAYVAVPPERRVSPHMQFTEHLVYGESYGLIPIFNHYDPLQPTWFDYLQRCVHRFKAAIAAREPQLLLGICFFGRGDDEDFDRLVASLEGSRAAVWVMGLHEGQDRRGIEVRRQVGVHRVMDLFTVSRSDGVNFGDPADSLMVQGYLKAAIRLDASFDPRHPSAGA